MTHQLSNIGVMLPSSSTLTEEPQKYIVSCLEEYLTPTYSNHSVRECFNLMISPLTFWHSQLPHLFQQSRANGIERVPRLNPSYFVWFYHTGDQWLHGFESDSSKIFVKQLLVICLHESI